MAWRRSGDKPLSEPMMVRLPTHICVTRPQCVNPLWPSDTIWGHRTVLKRYAQPTIRYDTRYDAQDTIRSAIHLPFLPGKQRFVIPACDQKHCTPPTTTACAVMMRSGYNNGSLLGVSRCSVFMMNSLVLLEYTDCFLWYLVFVSNLGMCYICTVSSSERIAIRTVAFVSAIYRCAGVSFQPY